MNVVDLSLNGHNIVFYKKNWTAKEVINLKKKSKLMKVGNNNLEAQVMPCVLGTSSTW